jgi:DNA-binding NarL/FixJ family response regulator
MSISVFLADDHTVVRAGLRALLEAQDDIEVIGEAADGRDMLEQAIELRPDVAILDITMPELNGIEVTARLCSACPSTQVIILSMHSTNEHIYRALQAGAQGYLLKESAGSEIVNAIRAVYEGHRFLSQKISDIIIDDYMDPEASFDSSSPLEQLSFREREILQLVVEGRSSVDIATVLHLSPKSVETYRSRMMRKLRIKDIPTLVKFAIMHGLTSLD